MSPVVEEVENPGGSRLLGLVEHMSRSAEEVEIRDWICRIGGGRSITRSSGSEEEGCLPDDGVPLLALLPLQPPSSSARGETRDELRLSSCSCCVVLVMPA